MGKCPFCGAETRPEDNFCLNCGNRLVSATPSSSPQQAIPGVGDATLAAQDEWSAPGYGGWHGDASAAPTVASSGSDQATYRADPSAPTMQATLDRIDQPGRLILRSENGDVVQEYLLDKFEISIGRAPNSDILLSKDKLTSRRHATVRYENGHYFLRDERSANGTFVNGQQIEEMAPRLLQDGDHISIGEHDLLFRIYVSSVAPDVEDLPTVAVPYDAAAAEMTYRTREDDMATVASSDDYGTRSMETSAESQPAAEPIAAPPPPTPEPEPMAVASNGYSLTHEAPSVPSIPESQSSPADSEMTVGSVAPAANTPPPPVVAPEPVVVPRTPASTPAARTAPVVTSQTPVGQSNDGLVTFNRLTSLSTPGLPDLTALVAAMSTLDGQLMSLQEQFNATQEALREHDSQVAQNANQLRIGIRRVSERMDNTIADVARTREALAWAELLQLMEDVMNNPRDIEYVTKLARKARELNKVFQLHQNVLNTMAECNSLLRSMIGEEK